MILFQHFFTIDLAGLFVVTLLSTRDGIVNNGFDTLMLTLLLLASSPLAETKVFVSGVVIPFV